MPTHCLRRCRPAQQPSPRGTTLARAAKPRLPTRLLPAAPPPFPASFARSFKGTRFLIGRTTLFNVEAPSGALVGQAVTIREWEYEDGTKVGLSVFLCFFVNGSGLLKFYFSLKTTLKTKMEKKEEAETTSVRCLRVGADGDAAEQPSSLHVCTTPVLAGLGTDAAAPFPLLPLPSTAPQGGENVDGSQAAAAAAAAAGPPTAEQLAAAEAAVTEQGALVRWGVQRAAAALPCRFGKTAVHAGGELELLSTSAVRARRRGPCPWHRTLRH